MSDWLPGATIIKATDTGGSMTGRDAYVTWHTTESPYTATPTALANYLNTVHSQVHLIWNPVSGAVVQMMPASQAGRGLENAPGGVETNRQGRVNIQIETVGRASRPFTKDLTPTGRLTLLRIITWLDQLGIPHQAPAGDPPASPNGPYPRSVAAWNGPGGYFGHSQVPENHHTDPGAVRFADLWNVTDGGFLMALSDAQQQEIYDFLIGRHRQPAAWGFSSADGATLLAAIQAAKVDPGELATALLPGLVKALPATATVSEGDLVGALREVLGSLGTPPAA